MELTDVLEFTLQVVGYTTGCVVLDQVIFPLAYSFVDTVCYNIRSRQVKMPELYFQSLLPQKFRAIDYLNLANSIVHASSEKEWDCKDFSSATFDTYMELLKKIRRDLKNKIRMCTALSGQKSAEGYVHSAGHIWLEVEVEGRMLSYETTQYTPLSYS